MPAGPQMMWTGDVDTLNPVVTIVVFLAGAAYIAVRTLRLRQVAEAKRRVLHDLIGTRVILMTGSERGTVRSWRRIGGVLVDVTRRDVAVDTGGRVASIALRGVRSVGDDRGSTLGTW